VKRQSRFAAAAFAVVALVGYLMVTGMRDSMMYYHTPDELAARVAADPSVYGTGVKMGGRVVPGTVEYDPRTLDLRFHVVDVASGVSAFPVRFVGPVPDTFEEGRDVVLEGQLTAAGTFEATQLLTKCGSRYDAVEEDFRA
jgi:cytochrome c-type biogenesis protein CcmE